MPPDLFPWSREVNNDGNGETKAFRLPSLCSPRTRKLTFVIAQRFEVAGALSTSEPGHVEWKLSKEIWDTFAHYPQGSSIHSPRFEFGASEKGGGPARSLPSA